MRSDAPSLAEAVRRLYAILDELIEAIAAQSAEREHACQGAARTRSR